MDEPAGGDPAANRDGTQGADTPLAEAAGRSILPGPTSQDRDRAGLTTGTDADVAADPGESDDVPAWGGGWEPL